MNDTKNRIAAGLERAFAERGFAEPNVEDLRAAAGVSLRTLYKYAPSREAMVRLALEHRNERYVAAIFDELPDSPIHARGAIIDRVAAWMAHEAAHGCLFHGAVAASPHDAQLRATLEAHKSEVAARAVRATGLTGHEADLILILDGLTQSWPLLGKEAVASAKRLVTALAALTETV